MEWLMASLIAGSVMTVLAALVSSQDVCIVGSMIGIVPGGLPHWFLPHDDPCKCTAIRLGGMTLQPPSYQRGSPYNLTSLILSEDVNAIRAFFKCRASTTSDIARCESPVPLGLEDGSILNSQITASSQVSEHHGPSHARLNNGNGYWTPLTNAGSWIEVNLAENAMVTGVIIQGSPFDDGAFVTACKIGYRASTSPTSDYQYVNAANGEPMMFQSQTTDAKAAVTVAFPETIEATVIRIEPLAWHIGVGLRFELLGCYN
ncbi:lactadherin-like [Patiria miniata]|uniref:F5/8 type C domain-containing protein n=1 Tax=Patiria miniata TaxID=46514 RepID=A0A913Z7F3_PATMI|nr:lactadherin-like [Patiria miniata]